MKRISLFALAAVFLTVSFPARAIYFSSSDLGRYCLSDAKEDIYACTSYIAGVIDYHTLMQSLGTTPTMDFCMPDDISMQKAAVIVMAYLRISPQNDDFVAASAVPLALNRAFPCAQPRKRLPR